MLVSQLEYKAGWYGGEVVKVDPRRTSHECLSYGVVSPYNRLGKVYDCADFGMKIDADMNAARNILGRAMSGAWDVRPGGTARKVA